MFEFIVLLVFMAVVALESLAYFVFPSVLARAAFVPLKLTRLVELPPEFLAEDRTAGYRQAAKRVVALTKLTWPAYLTLDDAVGEYCSDGGFCWLRLKYTWFVRKPLGIVKIKALPVDNNVNLVVTWYPHPTTIALLPFVFSTHLFRDLHRFDLHPAMLAPFLFMGVVVLIHYFWGKRRMKDQTRLALEVIADSFLSNRPR